LDCQHCIRCIAATATPAAAAEDTTTTTTTTTTTATAAAVRAAAFYFLQPEEQNLQTVTQLWLPPQAAQEEARPLSKEEKVRRELQKSQFKPNVNHKQGKDNRAEIRERNIAKQRQLKQQQKRASLSPSMMPASGEPSQASMPSSVVTSSADSGEDILDQMIYGIQGDIVAGQEAMHFEQTDDDDTMVGYDETMG
jgi:hypothetical protein